MATPALQDMQVGDSIPALQLPAISRTTLALYAGASGDHNPIHIDIDFARSAGLDDVFGHGMLSAAYVGRLDTDWAGQPRPRRLPPGRLWRGAGRGLGGAAAAAPPASALYRHYPGARRAAVHRPRGRALHARRRIALAPATAMRQPDGRREDPRRSRGGRPLIPIHRCSASRSRAAPPARRRSAAPVAAAFRAGAAHPRAEEGRRPGGTAGPAPTCSATETA